MTTEGDGNYGLQRFLESEGAEADIQLVTAWLLYTLWEAEHDTKERATLRGADKAKYGLGDIAAASASGEEARRLRGAARHPRPLPDVRARHRPLRLQPAEHERHRRDLPRVLQQRPPWRRRPHGSRQAHHERHAVEGAHDAEREAVRLHAERGGLGRRAVGDHREVPRHHLLPGRDERRRARQLLLARADVPLQGEAGGHRRVRARAHDAGRDEGGGQGVPRREPALRERAPQGAAPLRGQLRGHRRRGRAVHHPDPRAAHQGAPPRDGEGNGEGRDRLAARRHEHVPQRRDGSPHRRRQGEGGFDSSSRRRERRRRPRRRRARWSSRARRRRSSRKSRPATPRRAKSPRRGSRRSRRPPAPCSRRRRSWGPAGPGSSPSGCRSSRRRPPPACSS